MNKKDTTSRGGASKITGASFKDLPMAELVKFAASSIFCDEHYGYFGRHVGGGT